MTEVEKYIEGYPKDVQIKLNELRKCILEMAPNATERICMRMPTYDLNGKWLVHFAAFKTHIGFYPQPEGILAFKDDLKDYKTTKGTVQFPIDKELPMELIKKIVRYRVEEQSK